MQRQSVMISLSFPDNKACRPCTNRTDDSYVNNLESEQSQVLPPIILFTSVLFPIHFSLFPWLSCFSLCKFIISMLNINTDFKALL